MKLVIFGLAVSSSWGNGHAVLWRALIRALAERGHWTVFFERDVPYYAAHRDLTDLAGGRLVLYSDWAETLPEARQEVAGADAAIVTSYCPDAPAATDLVLKSPGLRVFYDLDTPVTLAKLSAREPVGYIGEYGLSPFDLVLSYTGGAALPALQEQLGARRVAALYGSVDPDRYRPFSSTLTERAALSYLGTYADDRQAALNRFFIEPARRR
ncbi:MAG: glycosyltransferase, partial [Alphaproteobacteria bacterium]|nr:glycosyltransferase [Alphaproteobacteria bacterium]